jgi:uncharacterized Zn-binding protein involved in type VI secretion
MAKQAARITDIAEIKNDGCGCKSCVHHCIGPIVSGSENVYVNELKAARATDTDTGQHSGCCGSGIYTCTVGSSTVFVNGKPFARLGDLTTHCGGVGEIIQTPGCTVIVGG